MFFKAFLFAVLCTVTLVQPENPLWRKETSGIKLQGPIKRAVDKLVDEVKEQIAEAKADLANLKNDLRSQAEQITEGIKEGLADQISGLLDELNELKNKAKQRGTDVKDCVVNREKHLINIPVDFGKEIYQCGKDKVEKGVEIISEAEARVENVIKKARAYVAEYKACSTGYFVKTCKGAVAVKAATAGTTTAIEIRGHVDEAVNFVTTLQSDLRKCGLEKVRQALSDAKEIFGETKGCIESKMNSS